MSENPPTFEAAADLVFKGENIRRLRELLSQQKWTFRGEVVEVKPWKTTYFVTFRDPDTTHSCMTARLVAGSQLPDIGNLVEFEGYPYLSATRAPGLKLQLADAKVLRNITLLEEMPTAPDRPLAFGPERTLPQGELTQLVAREPSPAFARPLPRNPRRIALVTSEASKARADIQTAVDKRGLGEAVATALFPCDLFTPASIAEAVKKAGMSHPDVVVVTRGGGAAQDLGVFDDPLVVTSVAQVSREVPVLTAIGHATDAVKAERFASASAATPTAAVEALFPADGPLEHRPTRTSLKVAAGAVLGALAAAIYFFFRSAFL